MICMSTCEVVPKLLIFHPGGLLFRRFKGQWLFGWTIWQCSLEARGRSVPLYDSSLWSGRRDETSPQALGCTAGIALRLGLRVCAKVREETDVGVSVITAARAC